MIHTIKLRHLKKLKNRNMKSLFNLLLIIALFISCNVFGQTAPGYMGRKLVISYSPNFSPTIANPNKNNKKGLTSFNLNHEVSVEYSLSRKVSLGGSFQMYQTGVDYNFSIYEQRSNQSSYNGYDVANFRNDVGYGLLNVKAISVYRLKFRKGISPLGKHSILGIKILHSSTDLSNTNFTDSYYNSATRRNELEKHKTTEKSISTVNFGIVWGYGVNRVIKDLVVLKFGFKVNYMFMNTGDYFRTVRSPNDQNTSEFQEIDMFKNASEKRLFAAEFFNITIGIGFLAH
jgi:hypothetical protein